MKYQRPEFILDPPEAAVLELPGNESYHQDQAKLLAAVILEASLKVAEQSVEAFELLREEGHDMEAVFAFFDVAGSETKELLTMGSVLSAVVPDDWIK